MVPAMRAQKFVLLKELYFTSWGLSILCYVDISQAVLMCSAQHMSHAESTVRVECPGLRSRVWKPGTDSGVLGCGCSGLDSHIDGHMLPELLS